MSPPQLHTPHTCLLCLHLVSQEVLPFNSGACAVPPACQLHASWHYRTALQHHHPTWVKHMIPSTYPRHDIATSPLVSRGLEPGTMSLLRACARAGSLRAVARCELYTAERSFAGGVKSFDERETAQEVWISLSQGLVCWACSRTMIRGDLCAPSTPGRLLLTRM